MPKIIKYRSYSNFDNETFISNLRVAFSEIYNENELLSLKLSKIFLIILLKHMLL